MFGKPKDAPFRLTRFDAGGMGSFAHFNCAGYACENLPSFAKLLELVREKAAAHPDHVVLATLDDYMQASYTSGHATGVNDLEQAETFGLDGPAGFDDDDDPPELPPEMHFAIIHANLLDKAKDFTLKTLASRLFWNHEDTPPFVALNENPDTVIDRKQTFLLLAPVAHAWEAVAAFPNGYFAGDLSPMENLALARHLETIYSYRLFGIGSSWIGFLRTTPLNADEAHALALDIQSIHRDADPADLPAMAATLQKNDWLLLFYSAR